MQWWIEQQLKSKNPTVGREGVKSPDEGTDTRRVHLLTTSLSARDTQVRLNAVRSLSRIRDEMALPPLLAALKDPAPAVRESAATGLKFYGDRRTIPHLKPLLNDPDPSTRAAAARALQSFGWEPADDRERVRLSVALGEYQQAALLGEGAFEVLASVLQDNNHLTGRRALEAMAQLDDPRVPGMLVECLQELDLQVRVAAAEELGRFPGEEHARALCQALDDPEPLLRAAAACSLSRIGDSPCIPHLIEALNDEHWSVRKAAVDALGGLHSLAALEPLLERLKDSDHDVREATVIALGRIGDQRAVEWLVGSLADPNSSVRNAAAAVLATLDPDWASSEGARRAIAVLEPLREAKEYWVRHAAGAVLAKMRGEGVPLNPCLIDGNVESSSRRMKVLETLMSAVEDFDRDIRLAAAEALGRLEDSSCAGHLRMLVKDPDEWVQKAAAKALPQVTRPPVRNHASGLGSGAG